MIASKPFKCPIILGHPVEWALVIVPVGLGQTVTISDTLSSLSLGNVVVVNHVPFRSS